MNDFHLPGRNGDISLPLTLKLVENMEQAGGSLYKIADMLVSHEMPLTDILRLLCVAYKTAGIDDNDITAFLLRDCPKPPAVLLTDLLVAILTPLNYMGGTDAGKTKTASAA